MLYLIADNSYIPWKTLASSSGDPVKNSPSGSGPKSSSGRMPIIKLAKGEAWKCVVIFIKNVLQYFSYTKIQIQITFLCHKIQSISDKNMIGYIKINIHRVKYTPQFMKYSGSCLLNSYIIYN